MNPHSHIVPLIPCYDAFFIDQFGTLHDGRLAYPGATAALMRIRAAGRVALSQFSLRDPCNFVQGLRAADKDFE